MIVLVVCGLAAEARIAAGRGVVTVAAPPATLPSALARVAAADAVVSFGIAGGLDPALAAGTVCVATAVVGGATFPADPRDVADRLAAAGIACVAAPVAAAPAPVATVAAKRDLFAATGAAAVDTESGIAAAWAARRGVRFVALRAIADAADTALPPLAFVAIAPDGRLAPGAIARALVRQPGQLASLPGTAAATRRAFGALRRVRAALGPGFGLG